MADTPLTAADLPRIHFRTTDHTGAECSCDCGTCTDRQFALWLRNTVVGRNTSVSWEFPVYERVKWVNKVDAEKPIVLTAHPREDGRL